MDELLVKYILGESTVDEIKVVENWVNLNNDNLAYFNQFKLIWESSAKLNTSSEINVDETWIEFKQLVKQKESPKKLTPLYRYPLWLKVAASLFILLGAVAIIYTYKSFMPIQMLDYHTASNIEKITLEDGSELTMNKYSTVSYPEKFNGKSREITLEKGEVFFSITKDTDRPFLIHVHDAVVKVVGTSFNIKIDSSSSEVIVETGSVEVIQNNNSIQLKPKERADIAYGVSIIKTKNEDDFYNYYRTKQIVANNTPLWRIVEILNTAYDVDITIKDKSLAERKLSTVLILNSLAQNLDLIEETFNVKIHHDENSISIY